MSTLVSIDSHFSEQMNPLITSISEKLSRIIDAASSDPNLSNSILMQLEKATQALQQGRSLDPLVQTQTDQLLYDIPQSIALTQALQGIVRQMSAEKERVRQKLATFDPKTSPACIAITQRFGADVRQHCLCEIAKYLARKKQLVLDRDSKRRKCVLMKWFHDNWAVLEPLMAMFKIVGEEVIVEDPDATAPALGQ